MAHGDERDGARGATASVTVVTGEAMNDVLPALAALRIDVFRDFPYLYDGDLAYEQDYLAGFAQAADAVIVVAEAGGEIVGCATGSGLDGQHDAFAEPLRAAGLRLEGLFYCGESVLRAEHRGQGLGHAFFDGREAHARACGYDRACFCAVDRPADHPLRPADYRPLDPFWTKRGYQRLEGLVCRFDWRDVDKLESDEKPMRYWMRDL